MTAPLLVLFSAAITVVFVKGSLFDPLRARGPKLWRKLAACALCSGVWVGAAATAAAVRWEGFHGALPPPLEILGVGALTGVSALLYVRVTDWLDSAAAAADSQSELAKGVVAEQRRRAGSKEKNDA